MKRIAFILTLVLFAACDNSYLESENLEELVVEGWIESGHAPVVMVHTTLPISSTPRPVSEIQDHILRYANVYIDTDEGREYLTARLTDRHTVMNYFTSPTLRGEVGKTYRLGVEWQNFKATASCTIPEPVSIDSSYFEKAYNDTSYVFKIRFKNNPSEKRYYTAFKREGAADTSNFKLSSFSTLKASQLDTVVNISFMKSPTSMEPDMNLYYHSGDRIAIKLATIEENMYDFWMRYINAAGTTGSLILSYTSNIYGNVDGAIGYWAGYGVDVVEKTVP